MDIKAIIKKLQSIDAKDFKNIDFNQAKAVLTSRIDIVLIVLLISITFFSTLTIYNGRKKKAESLNIEITEKEEKLIIVEKYRELTKEFHDFIDNYPKHIPRGQLINKLSEFAIQHNVQIENFAPASQQTDDYTKITTIQINISSEGYNNIILFMRAIETAPYSITVEEWSGKIKGERSSSRGRSRRRYTPITEENKPKFIEANVKIGSVEIKNDS